ncbi:MAG TPA: DEAD/DEAH box helicase [Deltaproteobacteria bacterium]|nr:DEAD/DEAH box helicase [Deltaproteobacteria bacterium]
MRMEYRGLVLDPFQEQAIEALEANHSVLVCAPTGTGKTIIADWIVEEALREGRQVIYTAPIKALSNQKFRDYRRLYGEERVGLVTGDLVIQRDAPCRVMTTEILRNILLSDEELGDLRAVVLDEVHFLDDRERGTVWEEVLIYLPPEVQIIGLSATLSNVEDFAAWLEHVRGRRVEVVQESRRAVPLKFYHFSVDTGLVTPQVYDRRYRRKIREQHGHAPRHKHRGRRDQRRRGRRRKRRTGHVDVFRALRGADLLPYLFFVFSRRDTEVLARALTNSLRDSLLTRDERALCDLQIARAELELGYPIDDELRHMYRGGVGFHHAGLHVGLKALVESLYEEKLLRVLYCTSTFALGINMPARSVVFDGLKKYDGRGVNPLTTRQFMQKAGRAGRRGMDEVGHVVLRMDFSDYEEYKPLIERYQQGISEPVRSSFNLSFNSIVHLLEQHDTERIRGILDSSFLAWHLDRKARSDADQAAALWGGTRREERRAAQLESRADRARSRVYDEFQAKVSFLQRAGYLGEDLSFNAGARALAHLQIAEVFVTEIVLAGLLEDLSPTRTFGVLAGVTNNLPRHARPTFRPRPEDRQLSRHIARLRNSWVVTEAESLSDLEVGWDPDVMHLGILWAEGVSLQDIVDQVPCDTDVSGDLITGFRRAKDLASQLVDVYREIPERRAMLLRLIQDVSRDEVEVVG